MSDERKAVLSRQAPALEWSAALPPTTDFKTRAHEMPAPEKLKPGFYFLVASHDRNFGDQRQPGHVHGYLGERPRAGPSPAAGHDRRIRAEANSGEPVAARK